MAETSFPLATLAEVRRELAARLRTIPHARRTGLIALILLTLGAAANVAVPLQLGGIVDLVVGDAQQNWVVVSLGLLGAAVIAAVCSAAGFYLLSRVSERVISDLREQMVGTALGLPAHRVEDAGSGDLVSRSTDDVAELSSAVTETLPFLSRASFTTVATAIALVGLQWQFLIIPAVMAPLYFWFARSYLKRAPGRYAAERAAMADRARRVLEAIHARATIRAFRREDATHDRTHEASARVVEHGLSARCTMIALQVKLTFGDLLMMVMGLGIGFWTVARGDLTVGAVTAAMLMLIRLRGPVMQLMRVLDSVQSGYASLARIVGVIVDPPTPTPDSGVTDRRTGEVILRDVSFSYGDAWAVRDVDLRIAPGETVAMVGASGAGKTTVAALVAGLRVPDSGEVLVDGAPVTSLSDKERVARLALVSQEVHVFSGTLRDDLTLARPTARDEELIDALERVYAGDWFRELPDGLDTEVGARGLRLPPVQAQQLALARMLLLDPAVVILDEATAEAGSSGAGELEAAAEEVMKNRSALVVAHRLDSAERADRVVVMDAGRITESGTHEELLAHGGEYATMFSAWERGRE
ncbi:ABC transporter ATP-binding protein [Corynebacterium yudongzhengii]|uniref:ABC transporter ATP-binding protein n=1 Tax=Corynebacterium yudongzhengii TaxID=2080740 RepID=A0A2U1T8J9_9CORY|nr:ABC transporter ATP-binding protein [Corynebacterium yudongzhengii]AWB81942.1 ABC transporter ATP-binding protein [Corynebacterium yudongzhengii]PWC02334.1 ABC transporter ATP-binding protein [Corynebacterium yudongzhengii]